MPVEFFAVAKIRSLARPIRTAFPPYLKLNLDNRYNYFDGFSSDVNFRKNAL
jgi:hypothetical protein